MKCAMHKKPRNFIAKKLLTDRTFRPKIIRNRKKYTRKIKHKGDSNE